MALYEMKNDIFGLNKEGKITNSGVRSIFTPHSPINQADHFFGRESEAERFVSVVNTPGLHVLVYGDRGVGKTSLAITTCKVLLHKILNGGAYIEKRCASQDGFETIVKKAFDSLNIDYSVKEYSSSNNSGGRAGLKIPFAEAGIESKNEKKSTHISNFQLNSPSWVCDKIKDKAGIFLIDEVDALLNGDDRKKIAELVKLLSDVKSNFKIVIVGIASTGSELIDGHPSVQRCLKEVQLKRMSDEDIRKIIVNGFNKAKMIPTDFVVDQIVDISAGLPYFTHLICLKCAEISVINSNKHIDDGVLRSALMEAVKDAENVLRDAHHECIKSFSKQGDYKILLFGASHCKGVEFSSRNVKDQIVEKLGVSLETSLISRKLNNIVSNKDHSILLKCGRGFYKFVDPRMPSYVKMLFDNKLKSQ